MTLPPAPPPDSAHARTSREDEQALQAYLDGELSAVEASALEARLTVEPALRAALDDLELVGRWFTAAADREARTVPQARFEQLWDDLDVKLARESALPRAARVPGNVASEAGAGWWARLRWPVTLTAAAATAALAFAVIVSGPSQGEGASGGQPGGIASAEQQDRGQMEGQGQGRSTRAPSEPQPEGQPDPGASPDARIADAGAEAPPAALPIPESNDADIERIEFGGASGQITRIEGVRGTTTVIWVEEDDTTPAATERSL